MNHTIVGSLHLYIEANINDRVISFHEGDQSINQQLYPHKNAHKTSGSEIFLSSTSLVAFAIVAMQAPIHQFEFQTDLKKNNISLEKRPWQSSKAIFTEDALYLR